LQAVTTNLNRTIVELRLLSFVNIPYTCL